MNKNLTEIVFILDRSGSMAGLEGDTIGGFNAMVEKQKKEEGEALLSAVLFDNDSEVQRMVKHEQEKYGWEFLFLGANMDAISAARTFGIREDRAVRYECDSAGTGLNFAVVSETIGRVRRGRPIDAGWSAPIEADYKRRGRK